MCKALHLFLIYKFLWLKYYFRHVIDFENETQTRQLFNMPTSSIIEESLQDLGLGHFLKCLTINFPEEMKKTMTFTVILSPIMSGLEKSSWPLYAFFRQSYQSPTRYPLSSV